MSKWATDELNKIDEADDLKISPFREDGVTYGTPTWIWNVVVKGDLYVRAYSGNKSSWYQAALKQKRGKIHAAGMVKEVSFEQAGDSINNLVDKAYQAKYKGSSYLNAMISEKARLATVKIVPL